MTHNMIHTDITTQKQDKKEGAAVPTEGQLSKNTRVTTAFEAHITINNHALNSSSATTCCAYSKWAHMGRVDSGKSDRANTTNHTTQQSEERLPDTYTV